MDGTQQGRVSPKSEANLESQSSDEERPPRSGLFVAWNERISSLKWLETRGIERVPESERHAVSASNYVQMALLWFSTNVTANNISVGMLGPLSFGLGFTDAALCATFGVVLGATGVAYMSTFGPASGNRTMVLQRPRCS
jgi:purine-cytosine permease-like protein